MNQQPNAAASSYVGTTRTLASPLVLWTPLAGLLLIAGLTGVLLSTVVEPGAFSPTAEVTLPTTTDGALIRPFAERLASLTWSLSILFFAYAIAVTFGAAFHAIGSAVRSTGLKVGAFTSFAATGATIWFLLPASKGFQFNRGLFDGTVYKVARHAEIFVDGVQILGTVALAAVAVASSLILSRASNASDSQSGTPVTARAASLSTAQQRIRNLLYVSALPLIAGTLQASALYSWAQSMMTPEEWSTDFIYYSKIKDVPHAMAMLNGSFYSLILAVIFVPAMFILRVLASRLAEEANPQSSSSERNKWIEDHSIGGTVPRQLISALVVLSPTLAGGTVTALLEMIAAR